MEEKKKFPVVKKHRKNRLNSVRKLFQFFILLMTPCIIKCDRLFELNMEGRSIKEYRQAIEKILCWQEKLKGETFRPGGKGRAAIKIHCSSGKGLETPANLVRGAIDALCARGYRKKDIFLIDVALLKMWECGFISTLGPGPRDFYGVSVYALDSDPCWDEAWFYDCPLLGGNFRLAQNSLHAYDSSSITQKRRSYLPVFLLFDVDFWLNLTTVRGDTNLGICGAVANATLFNISNNHRFLHAPENAAVSCCEIFAIPEFRAVPIVHIVDLHCFQLIDRTYYDAYFCRNEKMLIASSDPFLVDFYCWRLLNNWRKRVGFGPISRPAIFDLNKRFNGN